MTIRPSHVVVKVLNEVIVDDELLNRCDAELSRWEMRGTRLVLVLQKGGEVDDPLAQRLPKGRAGQRLRALEPAARTARRSSTSRMCWRSKMGAGGARSRPGGLRTAQVAGGRRG